MNLQITKMFFCQKKLSDFLFCHHKIDYIYFKFTPMPRNFIIIVAFFAGVAAYPQNIQDHYKMLVTFGNMSGDTCVDDDFSQAVFCALPAAHTGNIYFRIFDPDCGGVLDQPNGLWETNTVFEIYGGSGCISDKAARGTAPVGNYKSGKLLQREIFAKEPVVDGTWVSMGPFDVSDGEELDAFPGYIFFKLLVEGHTGNDGNLYGLFLSSSPDMNREIPRSSFFDYERIVLDGNSLVISRADAGLLRTEEIMLPVKLSPLKTSPEYNIIAEPVDD